VGQSAGNLILMKVWILNHYGGLPGGGRFERPVYMARAFQRSGHQCTVFYSSYHHLLNVPSETLKEDLFDGVTYVGVPCRKYQGNKLGRILNMLDFSPSVLNWMKKNDVGVPDLVIASSPHPFCIDAGKILKKKFGTICVFEVRDLWPESLIELAGVNRFHPFVWWISSKVRQACRLSDAVVSLLPETKDVLVAKGMTKEKFHWIPNGIDVELHQKKLHVKLPSLHSDVIGKIRKKGSFLIGYAGAMGPPNALDQLVRLAGICKNEKVSFEILLVGDGVSKNSIQTELSKIGCEFIHILPSLKKDEVPSFLEEMDANIILWNDVPLYRFGVSPNKVSEYMLSKKPVVWVGNTANDPVKTANCGVSLAPNDALKLKQVLDQLVITSKEERVKKGLKGYNYALNHLNWEFLGRAYVSLIESFELPRK
jgi:glycosyltransferase involved in cell wall biosynthesis